MKKLVTGVELARELGVDRRQVGMWAFRRANNGFPQPAGTDTRTLRTAPLYDLDECREWHASYVPRKGGRPPGAS